MDKISPAHRAWNMSRIRSRGTEPERQVRQTLRKLHLRYRSQQRLPGTPDFVLIDHRAAVFVHGCFWHRHPRCRFAYTPKSRVQFWRQKFESNVQRDRRARKLLRRGGWRTIVIWECQLRDPARVMRRLAIRTNRSPRNA
ncbi:MAG: DNA mismatch endonuclease Vsr [Planctomycetes bacterium]|nr:DNA mismatch endonuclease Vsr [Planctomycetota bacterium]